MSMALTTSSDLPVPSAGVRLMEAPSEASKHYDKKQEAVDGGREISQNQHTEFVIHGKNGKIHQKDSHGNYPCPPKG